MATMELRMEELLACCGSSAFASEMLYKGPFSTLSQAIQASQHIWWNKVNVPGWLEAFSAHPRIGDVDGIRNKSKSTAEWSKGEQSTAIKSADSSILQELLEWNQLYEGKFGFIFLICATGKSSLEILNTLKERFNNRAYEELHIAAEEQQKITELRLQKLFSEKGFNVMTNESKPSDGLHISSGSLIADRRIGQIAAHVNISEVERAKECATPLQGQAKTQDKPDNNRPPITTHVLDVSRGRPGDDIEVLLEVLKVGPSTLVGEGGKEWVKIGSSVTNSDGRSGPLMEASGHVSAGSYRLTFNTGKYFLKHVDNSVGSNIVGGFYPHVSVVFEIKPSQVFEHFHVPLLLSPFSYTTYRGS